MSSPVNAAHDPAREARIVRVLAGLQFMHVLDFVLMMPLGPQLMRLFALTPRDFGLLVSVYMFAAAAAGIAASAVADRFDRRRVLLALASGFMLAAVATAAAQTYAMLLAAHAFAGAFGGVLAAQVHAFLGDVVPEGRRGRATGIVLSSFALASVSGVPLGILIADLGGSWRWPFAVLALGALPLIAVAARVLPPVTGHVAARRADRLLASYTRVLSVPNHWRAFVLNALATFAGFTVIPYLAPFMVRNVGLRESQIALLYFFGGLATFFTSRWIGRQCDLHGKQRMFRIVALASCVPLALTTNLPPVPLAVAIAASVLFMTLVSGRFVPAMALINSAAEPQLRGGFLALTGAVQQATAGSAALVAGLILGTGPGGEITHYGRVGALAVCATLLAVVWAPRVRARG